MHTRPAQHSDQTKLSGMIRLLGLNPVGVNWRRFIVLETAGELIGCVQLKHKGSAHQELSSLAILPSWQGQGLSSHLIQACIEASTAELFLVCGAQLEPLYAKHGFRTLEPTEQSIFYRSHLLFSRVFWGLMSQPRPVMLMRLEPSTRIQGVQDG